jgi:hypothetical protein
MVRAQDGSVATGGTPQHYAKERSITMIPHPATITVLAGYRRADLWAETERCRLAQRAMNGGSPRPTGDALTALVLAVLSFVAALLNQGQPNWPKTPWS